MKGKTYILILIMFLSCIESVAKKRDSGKKDWKLVKQSCGILIFTRWVAINDTIQTREMRAQYIVQAEITTVISLFKDQAMFVKWAVGIKECTIKSVNDSVWINYSLMNFPWPFRQRDLVTLQTVENKKGAARIQIQSLPKYIKEKPGIERIKNYMGTWNLKSDENGGTLVDCRVICYSKPMFPRFIQDPVILKLSLESHADLKQLAEEQ